MSPALPYELLRSFKTIHRINNYSTIAALIYATHWAKEESLPLQVDWLLTVKAGNVSGLTVRALERILFTHGIEKSPITSAGRTNRRSQSLVQLYVSWLNKLHETAVFDLDAVECWWVARFRNLINQKGFKLSFPPGQSVQASWEQLFALAAKAQKENPGSTLVGAMLQHLVGAKLEAMLGADSIPHHGHAVADAPTGRNADFAFADTCVHVTAAPSEALIRKCADNASKGLKPVIVTLSPRSVQTARQLAEQQSMDARLEIVEAAQFLTTNIYEWGRFGAQGRKDAVARLIDIYNRLIDEHENEPALRVQLV